MLPHSIEVYIPHTFNAVTPADSSWELRKAHTDIVRLVKTHMAKAFGGFTAHSATGGWHSDTHGLIEEPVTIVGSHFSPDAEPHVSGVFDLAKSLAKEMGQEAVAVKHNGVMHFVTPGD